MSVTTRRRIFAELRRSGETLTTGELARRLVAHLPTVANTCSHMEIMGTLDRPSGPRRGYRLIVGMLPDDIEAIADMVRVYGGDAMLDAVEMAAAEQRDAREREAAKP
jgi:hypothetical protein